MNQFERELLVLSYQNFQCSGSVSFEFLIKSSEALLNYKVAALNLSADNLIIPISRNIIADSVQIPEELLLEFELTDLGLSQAEKLSKEQ